MISVIIPACNESKYIEKTLKNLPEEVEKIVVCNACNDNTEKIAEKYAKVYSIKEKGVCLARNYGIGKCKGDIIIFLDADTIFDDNLIKYLNSIKEKSFFGTCRVKPDNNKLIAKVYCSIKNLSGLIGTHNASGIIFCTRDILDRVKFNENISKKENKDFSIKAKKYGKRHFLDCYTTTSMRRFEKTGYLNVPLYWLKELFIKDGDYPLIR